MEYRGSVRLFDPSRIRTYPLRVRANKVGLEQFVDCTRLRGSEVTVADPRGLELREKLTSLAQAVAEAHRAGRSVILQTGAHSIKNGLSPIWIDLMERGILTLVATNFAAAIQSFELALTGASSESVDQVLPKGKFGLAFETGAYLNQARMPSRGRRCAGGEDPSEWAVLAQGDGRAGRRRLLMALSSQVSATR